MKPKASKTSKLRLHPETVRQLSATTLDDIAGGVGPKPLGAVWSDGAMCTGGALCTGWLGCSRGCA